MITDCDEIHPLLILNRFHTKAGKQRSTLRKYKSPEQT